MVSSRAKRPYAELVRRLGDDRAWPDVGWVARLTGRPESEVVRALHGVERHATTLEDIRRRHLEAGRQFYAQIRAPFELYALVRLLRPSAVVETGVSSGVSSAHFLLGLRDNRAGRLYSVDLPTRQMDPELRPTESPVSLPPGRATGWAVPAALRRRWDLTLGDARAVLPKLVERTGPVQLFLHDSLHTPTHLTFELETLRPHLSPGAVVLADNTNWTGQAFDRFARSLGVPVVRRGRTHLVGLQVPTSPGPASARAHTPRSRAKR